MVRLVAAGAALAAVVFGAAFGISRAITGGGGSARAAKAAVHATAVRSPAGDPALAAAFSGEPVALKLPPPSKPHPRKPAKHHSAASTAPAPSSAPAPTTSAPPTPTTPSSPAASPPTVPSVPQGSSSGGGSSPSTPTHRSSHHHSGSGSGTTTIP